MAQQTGILGLQGTVGGLTFRKDGSVSQKPASNKAAFMSSASMVRTRENASEFGRAATAGKTVREALRTLIAASSDRRLVGRLTKVMRDIIARDQTNARGARVVSAANAGSLLGFSFNLGASLGQSFHAPYTVNVSGGSATLNLPSLDAQTDVVAPVGTTHYRLLYGLVAVNFATGTYQQGTVAAAQGIQPLTAAAQTNVQLVATLAEPPTPQELVLVVLGIDFYQLVNGQYYPLNNNASNPLSVVYVSADPTAPASGGGGSPSFDTTLTGPDGSGQGVTLAADPGTQLRFNALASGGSAPASMDINVGGTQAASVAYLDRYNGQAFSFTDTGGVSHAGVFSAVVNF